MVLYLLESNLEILGVKYFIISTISYSAEFYYPSKNHQLYWESKKFCHHVQKGDLSKFCTMDALTDWTDARFFFFSAASIKVPMVGEFYLPLGFNHALDLPFSDGPQIHDFPFLKFSDRSIFLFFIRS